MVLPEITKHVDLDDTQFGSRSTRVVYDTMAVLYEFIATHKDRYTTILSMDIEGGSDSIDIDLLADLLMAQGCPRSLTIWVRFWASNRHARFRFNGCASKEFYLNKGIPQGSPLLPFLFGVYFADIFGPRLKYTPLLQLFVSSYVDDGLVAATGDSIAMVTGPIEEVYENCSQVARGGGRQFSALKMEWIGFGKDDWSSCMLGDVECFPTDDLHVLGMRFACNHKMSNHVNYWLDRGLMVRARIRALARRFGSDSGIGGWEVMRLVQGSYLPVVDYGLELVASDAADVKRINIHIQH